jgi:hypothetical protein
MFMKSVSSLNVPNGAVLLPHDAAHGDWEVELGGMPLCVRGGCAQARRWLRARKCWNAGRSRLAGETYGITTPNHVHLPATRAALAADIAVISDKPMTAALAEARELDDMVTSSAAAYGLTCTYAGYPLVREARRLVAAVQLGAIRKVMVEYSQGWLGEPIEREGKNKQAEWRVDPKRAGEGGCIGDISVHAFNLVEFVASTRVVKICADLNSIVPGRALDDDCNILLRFDNGAAGVPKRLAIFSSIYRPMLPVKSLRSMATITRPPYSNSHEGWDSARRWASIEFGVEP